jgi:hypothetical protein
MLGALVVVTGAVIVGRAATRLELGVPAWLIRHPALVVGSLALVLTVGSAFAMWWSFAGNPHSVDEMAQLFQARVFLSGRLAAPPPEPLEGFLFLHTWIAPSGWVSQFPPMHSLLLAIGMAGNVEWLINPLLGGTALVLVYLLTRGLYGERTALLAALLWASSAWVLSMSATYMNHASAAVFALGAWTFALSIRRERRWHFVLAGLFLGALGATRPLDAVAAALPVGVWLLYRRRWRSLIWVGVGGLPAVLVLGYFNWRVFGHPLEFGYLALYGKEQHMGFHTDVFGNAFTPLIAFSNLAAAVRRLHIYLFEWPIPALLPVAVWALFARHRHPSDFPIAVGILAGPALYFFYWHSGFYPGPRFYYLIAPLLVIGTARAFLWGATWVRARAPRSGAVRWDAALAAAGVIAVVWGAASLTPARLRAYRTDFLPALKHHPERELANRGVNRALVLVPESWGARILVDLWTLGIRPGLAERSYRWLDACELDRFADEMREAQLPPRQAEERLEYLMESVSTAAPPVRDWPDPTLRLRGGAMLPFGCQRELSRDLAGFALYGTVAWRNAVGLDKGIVFVRDLYEHNDRLLDRYPEWELWRLAPPTSDPTGPPVLTRLRGAGSVQAGRIER